MQLKDIFYMYVHDTLYTKFNVHACGSVHMYCKS